MRNGNGAGCPDGDLMMNRTIAAMIFGLTVGTSASALASEQARCGTVPKEKWLTSETVKARMAEQGYDVRSIKAERGCFEVKATDKNGARVEVYVNPETGTPLQSDSRHDDRS
jgi:hypothetical protein